MRKAIQFNDLSPLIKKFRALIKDNFVIGVVEFSQDRWVETYSHKLIEIISDELYAALNAFVQSDELFQRETFTLTKNLEKKI